MNGKQHKQIGAACGAGYTMAKYFVEKQNNPELEFPWGDLLLNTGIGFLLGSLPDWIEPATNPHHRKFFHSLTATAVVCYCAFGEHAQEWPEGVRKTAKAAALAYGSHTLVDGTTKFSISLIHPKVI